jgi:uncharacterized membrane protein
VHFSANTWAILSIANQMKVFPFLVYLHKSHVKFGWSLRPAWYVV